MRRLAVIMTCGAILFGSHAFAQENVSQKMTIQAGYGTVTMGGVQWQRFSFRPDIPIGNFGVGLDIELFIDNEGKISDEGWNFSNKNQVWDSILRKIYYVRYGKPFDRFYARAGALDNVTLGYGLIMDGYRNTLNYPADKKLGVDIALRDIGTFGIDFHAMMNSVGDLKNDGAVVGGRVAAKPLKSLNMPLLSKLTFGATFVSDINQFAGLKDTDDDGVPDFQDGFPDDKKRYADFDKDGYEDSMDIDSDGDNKLDSKHGGTDTDVPTDNDYFNISEDKDGISVAGLDVGIPLVENPFRLDLYGQYSQINTGNDNLKGGWGTGAPGLRLLAGRFLGQIEYRHFEGRFKPNYFDNLYEHERVTLIGNTVRTKENALGSDTLNGVFGRLSYNFFEMVSAGASYQTMSGDKSYQDLTGNVEILKLVLDRVPKISLVEGYFYNRYVEKSSDLFKMTQNTLYGTRIGFEVTPGMIIVWDTRYMFTPNAKGGYDKNRFVGIETVMSVK
jgi:hypothetical protein